MERLRKAESVLLGLESVVLVAVLLFLVGMSFLQVFLRQFFGGGILWCDTLLRHLVLWVGFLGAARAAAEEKHFAFEAVTEHLPQALHAWAAALARLTAVAVALLLAKASWGFVLEEKTAGTPLFTTERLSMPGWPFALILPVGFLLVALHTAARLWTAKIPEESRTP